MRGRHLGPEPGSEKQGVPKKKLSMKNWNNEQRGIKAQRKVGLRKLEIVERMGHTANRKMAAEGASGQNITFYYSLEFIAGILYQGTSVPITDRTELQRPTHDGVFEI
jgi:hypothetical protein